MFENVTNVSLNLSNTKYESKEIDELEKYFGNQTDVKPLRSQSEYTTIVKVIKSITCIELIIHGIKRVMIISEFIKTNRWSLSLNNCIINETIDVITRAVKS